MNESSSLKANELSHSTSIAKPSTNEQDEITKTLINERIVHDNISSDMEETISASRKISVDNHPNGKIKRKEKTDNGVSATEEREVNQGIEKFRGTKALRTILEKGDAIMQDPESDKETSKKRKVTLPQTEKSSKCAKMNNLSNSSMNGSSSKKHFDWDAAIYGILTKKCEKLGGLKIKTLKKKLVKM